MVEFGELHIGAVLIGALVYMVYGGIYYSSFLSKKNSKNKEISDRQTAGSIKYIVAVIVGLCSSIFMASLIQLIGVQGISSGFVIGLFVGMIISLVYVKNALFGLLSRKALMIALGDHLIVFALLGALHGMWN